MNSARKLAVALVWLACACDPTVSVSGGGANAGSSGTTSSSSGTTSSSSGTTSSSSGTTSSSSGTTSSSSGTTSSSSGTTSSSSGGGAPCAGLPLCDDFEGGTAGAPPPSTNWTIVSPNCSGTGRIVIDDAQAHGGSRSARVDGGAGYCSHVFMSSTAASGVGTVLYGRFFVRIATALDSSHVTFMAMRDANDGNKDLRMGGQSQILMYNRESDDATLPELSPAGIGRSVALKPLTWTCIEFRVDQGAGTLDTWVDGAAVTGLQVDATATADVDAQWLRRANWRPSVADFRLGWESYGGTTQTLWFDDVALSSQRIGCGGGGSP